MTRAPGALPSCLLQNTVIQTPHPTSLSGWLSPRLCLTLRQPGGKRSTVAVVYDGKFLSGIRVTITRYVNIPPRSASLESVRAHTWQNSISQACFFALAARLALYTGNQTYADWADKTWDWMAAVEFIDPQYWVVYDGAAIGSNCTDITPYQFSYNAGGMLHGAAAMYNFTESDKWGQRVDNLLEGAQVFLDRKSVV